MALYEIEFCTIIDTEGEIIGISLVSLPETISEMFCAEFPRALIEGRASIDIEQSDIKFTLDDMPVCAFRVNSFDASRILSMLRPDPDQPERELAVLRDGCFTPGFQLILEDRRGQGKKSEPIQPL